MAIFDVYGELSDAQTIATTEASDDIIDWTASDKSLGVADQLYLNITCNTTFAGNAGTLTIALCYDTVAPVDGSSTVIYQTPAFAIGSKQLTAYDGKTNGLILCMPLPDNVDEERILGLYYTVGAGPFTSGAIDAWIGAPMQSRYDTQVAASNV
jgi:hypothetical protein